MDKKIDLRANAKQIRRNLDMGNVSLLLVEKLRQHSCYKNAKNVMIFYPTKYEVNLLALLDDNKNFYLPRVCGENLLVCPYKVGDVLQKSAFKILEPVSAPVAPNLLDLIIVPALMVDKMRYRLGYGGGFYDKFLSSIDSGCSVKKLCLIPKELVVDELPHDCYDIPMDIIISI